MKTPDTVLTLLTAAGFVKHSSTAWVCHGDEKTYIIDAISKSSYRKIAITHKQAEDGSFCSVAGTKIKMYTPQKLEEWLHSFQSKRTTKTF